MEIISRQGDPNLAEVFVARFRDDAKLLAEFVDARDPERDPGYKWVIVVSSQFGCPIGCPMCDAGGDYRGDLTKEEILAQIDAVVARHPAARLRDAAKFKVQFARMGEPALNPAVLDALEVLPSRYLAPGLIPCIATMAPANAGEWFERLLAIRHGMYADGEFQLQISLNSTDGAARDRLMPWPKMSFASIAEYARQFHEAGTRKVALNFALTEGVPVDPGAIAGHFDPASACVKITPLNPTARSAETGLATALPPHAPEEAEKLCDELGRLGFDVILSIGDVRENEIGSNCGMAVRKLRDS
ncbi:MAG: radical SAM protein [Proteobacteria bacterium]|nr:radical SAM protein [Pseudomonadota bacterium]